MTDQNQRQRCPFERHSHLVRVDIDVAGKLGIRAGVGERAGEESGGVQEDVGGRGGGGGGGSRGLGEEHRRVKGRSAGRLRTNFDGKDRFNGVVGEADPLAERNLHPAATLGGRDSLDVGEVEVESNRRS